MVECNKHQGVYSLPGRECATCKAEREAAEREAAKRKAT